MFGFFTIYHRLIVLVHLCDDSALSLRPQPHNVGSNGEKSSVFVSVWG